MSAVCAAPQCAWCALWVAHVSPYIESVPRPVSRRAQLMPVSHDRKPLVSATEMEARVARIDLCVDPRRGARGWGTEATRELFILFLHEPAGDVGLIDELEAELGKPVVTPTKRWLGICPSFAGGLSFASHPVMLIQA